MIKTYCDTCENEIKPGEMIGVFSSIEYDLSGKSKGQPVKSEYMLCQSCKGKAKEKIVEMIADAKKDA